MSSRIVITHVVSGIISLFFLCACKGGSPGTLAGLPKPSKTMLESSGIWESNYFGDGFGEKTAQPYLTIKPVKADYVKNCTVQIRFFVYSDSGEQCLMIFVRNPRSKENLARYFDLFDVPIKFSKEGKNSLVVSGEVDSDRTLIFVDGEDACSCMKYLLENTGDVLLQIKDIGDEFVSATIDLEGLMPVYSYYASQQLAFDKTQKYEKVDDSFESLFK